MFSWFRRHEKHLVSFMVIIVMLVFGGLSTCSMMIRQPGPPEIGTVRGESVTTYDWELATSDLTKLQTSGLLYVIDPLLDPPIAGRDLFGRPAATRALTRGDVVRWLVVKFEAEAADVNVREDDVAYLMQAGLPVDVAVATARAAAFWQARLEGVHSADTERWMQYCYDSQEVVAKFVEIKPALFVDEVEISDEEVQAFYEEHKNVEPDGSAGTPGYLAPARAMVELCHASADMFREAVDVTDEEIAEYYAANKETLYVVKDEPEADEEKTGADEAEDAEKPEKPKVYKPLDEVKDSISSLLKGRKATEMAREKFQTMSRALQKAAIQYSEGEPWPIQQMAIIHGLGYVAPKDWQTEDDIRMLPGGYAVAARVFDEEVGSRVPAIVQPDSMSSLVLLQVLARTEARPRPLDEVRAQVEADLRREKAFDRAADVGREMAEAARASSLEEAAGKVKLPAVVAESPKTDEPEADQPETDAPQEPAALEVVTTGRMKRVGTPVVGLPETAKLEAFGLGSGQIAVVADRAQVRSVYVVQKIEEFAPDADAFYAEMQNYPPPDAIQRIRDWVGNLVAEADIEVPGDRADAQDADQP